MKLGCLAMAAQRIDTSGGQSCLGHLFIVLRDNPDLTGVESMLFDDEGSQFTEAGQPLPKDFADRNQVRLQSHTYRPASIAERN